MIVATGYLDQPMLMRVMEWSRRMVFLAGIASAQSSFGHGPIHDQVRMLDERIRSEPQNSEYLIRRGRLFLEANHITEAMSDLRRALDVDLNAIGARYYLGQAFLRSGDAAQAEREARLYLVGTRDQGEDAAVLGYRLLGQALIARNQPLAAAVAYVTALSRSSTPEPAQFLEAAEAYVAGGNTHLGRALKVLEEGMRRLGPLPLLQNAAVDIERKLGRVDAALSRLESLIAQGDAREQRLFLKGEILLEAKRLSEAEEAFHQAGNAVRALAPDYQKTKAVQTLTKEIDARLGALRKASDSKER
jgi:predicted Zn-dependent protease